MAETISLDPSKLTLDDLIEFEELVGKGLFEVLPSTEEEVRNYKPSPKAMRALVFLVKRQTDPSFTIEQAGKLTISDLEIAPPDPPGAAS